MKTIDAGETSLGSSLDDAQKERVVITRSRHPVAVLIGVEDLDQEQLALCRSAEFWEMISARRQEPTMSRAELQQSFSSE